MFRRAASSSISGPTLRLRAGIAAAALAAALGPGCSCSDEADQDGGGGSGGTAANNGGNGNNGGAGGGDGANTGQFMDGGGGSTIPCVNLECQQVDCKDGGKTTVTGTVYEPAGTVPLYNVAVYIPNAPLEALTDGAQCSQCGAEISGEPLVSALTDASGRFVLEDVPVGADIPLVIQVGKWRREFVIPTVAECTETPLEDTTIRLPRNQSEGHIPKIALTTGGADPLECWLPKVGLDVAEFTNPDGAGRVNLFAGVGGGNRYAGGADFPLEATLWASTDALAAYDIILLACEGDWHPETKGAAALQAMADYTALGGRVFASHWHNYWVENGPAGFPTVAEFDHQPDLANPFDALVDSSFPKGMAMSEWLVNVGASDSPGVLRIEEAQHTINAVNPALSTRWIYSDNPTSVQYLSFNTPLDVEPDAQCGRLVLSDIHVSSGDSVGQPFPNGCGDDELSPQEKALLFMLFDLSACITPDDEPPCAPGHDHCGEPGDPECFGDCNDGCCDPVPQ